MQETLFREYCRQRKFDAATTEASVATVLDLERYTTAVGGTGHRQESPRRDL
ncbi:MAG: hypothetical protein NTX94_06615 [Caldiserica bacterium]|nr:hypothetical protein [Caldisericota bacterium]